MTPAAQMSQRNRHDCVAAAGARRRHFFSTASYQGLLGREGKQRADWKKKRQPFEYLSLFKIPEGKSSVCLFIYFIVYFNLTTVVFIVSPATFLDDVVL